MYMSRVDLILLANDQGFFPLFTFELGKRRADIECYPNLNILEKQAIKDCINLSNLSNAQIVTRNADSIFCFI